MFILWMWNVLGIHKILFLLIVSAIFHALFLSFKNFIYLLYCKKLCSEFEHYIETNPDIVRLNAEKSMYFELYDAIFDIFKNPFSEGKREEEILKKTEIIELLNKKKMQKKIRNFSINWKILFFFVFLSEWIITIYEKYLTSFSSIDAHSIIWFFAFAFLFICKINIWIFNSYINSFFEDAEIFKKNVIKKFEKYEFAKKSVSKKIKV